MALAGGDAVDIYPWWVSLSLSSVHAETGVSQVQILPARPKLTLPKKAILEHYLSTDRIFVVFSFSVLGQTENLSASFTYVNWFDTQNYRGCLL